MSMELGFVIFMILVLWVMAVIKNHTAKGIKGMLMAFGWFCLSCLISFASFWILVYPHQYCGELSCGVYWEIGWLLLSFSLFMITPIVLLVKAYNASR